MWVTEVCRCPYDSGMTGFPPRDSLPDEPGVPDELGLFEDLGLPDDAVVEEMLAVLRDRGPLDVESLAELVPSAEGDPEDLLPELERALLDERIADLADGRVAALDVLLAGRVLTHRLTAEQIATATLPIADIEPLLALASGYEDFDILDTELDAEELTARGVVLDGSVLGDLLAFPPGTFDGFGPGDLLVFGADEGVTWEAVAGEPGSSTAFAGAVAAELSRVEPIRLDAVLFGLFVDDPAAFTTPHLPLTELLHEGGFARSGNLVAEADFDFEGHLMLAAFDAYAEQVGVPVEAVPAVASFASLAETFADGDVEDLEERFAVGRSGLYAELADPDVAETVVDQLFDENIGADALERAALWVRDHGPRRVTAAMSWIAGTAAEAAGRIGEAETLFGAAVDADGGFDPALLAAARYASDRGDVVRALSLLSRSTDARAAHTIEQLERFRPEEHAGLGRNDRCWCGSGRKYKVCHLGKADHSLDERAQWLMVKLAQHLDEYEWVRWRYLLADIRSGFSEDAEHVGSLASGDRLVADVVSAEAGAEAEFLDRRGHLLPDDERALLAGWVQERRSLWEIEEVAPGEGLTVRNLRSGERRAVTAPEVGDGNDTGLVVCARFIPIGDRWSAAGAVVGVVDETVDDLAVLLDADTVDPVVLVAALSGVELPPVEDV
mgnify:FL=1